MYDWNEKIIWNRSKNPKNNENMISEKGESGLYYARLFTLPNGESYSNEQIEEIVEEVYKNAFNKGYMKGKLDKLKEIKKSPWFLGLVGVILI